MGCWYAVSTAFAIRKDALNDVKFNEILKQLSDYAGHGDGHLFFQKEADPPVFSFEFGGSCTGSGPTKMDDWIIGIGAYAINGHAVHFRHEDEDGIFYIGPTDDAKRKAEIAYHLEVIREHVDALKIEEDPMYDEGPLPVDDVVNAIRALVENRNTLVVGSYPDEQRIDVSFVAVGSCRSDAKELIDDIQNELEDVEDIAECCPETIASNVFTAAAYYTARDLFNLAARLLEEPDVRRKSSSVSEQAGVV